jgi:adenosylcobinamide-GDP ribazoletransferase
MPGITPPERPEGPEAPEAPRPARRRDAALAAVALFTAVPVRATLPAAAIRAALRWCPVSGALVAAVATGVAAAGQQLYPGAVGAALTAAVTLSAAAVLTRGLHLDGLADTADGLGPLADRGRALAVMRQPDVGAFGVATLVLALLIQVGALGQALEAHRGLPVLALSVLVGRLAMLRAGLPGIPAARPDGLGATVAGTVPVGLLAAAGAALTAAAAVPALLGDIGLAGHLLVAIPAGLAAAELLLRRAVRVLGGVTGDVFGAVGELATTAALLAAAAG